MELRSVRITPPFAADKIQYEDWPVRGLMSKDESDAMFKKVRNY